MNDFKSKFMQWFINNCDPKESQAFKAALNKAIYHDLKLKDKTDYFQVRDLVFSKDLKFNFNIDKCWVKNFNNSIIIGTVTPGWHRGWMNLSKHKHINNHISLFFHFARQYLVRSQHVNFIGAVNLAYSVSGDFFGNMGVESKIEEIGRASCRERV